MRLDCGNSRIDLVGIRGQLVRIRGDTQLCDINRPALPGERFEVGQRHVHIVLLRAARIKDAGDFKINGIVKDSFARLRFRRFGRVADREHFPRFQAEGLGNVRADHDLTVRRAPFTLDPPEGAGRLSACHIRAGGNDGLFVNAYIFIAVGRRAHERFRRDDSRALLHIVERKAAVRIGEDHIRAVVSELRPRLPGHVIIDRHQPGEHRCTDGNG